MELILKVITLSKQTSFKQKITLVVFGLFLSLAFLEIGLRVGAVMLFSSQETRNLASLRQKDTYRIMCVGESTTALGGRDSYPSQLEDILNKRNMGVKFSVINKGIGASNTVTILYDLEKNLDTFKPDMVIAMMGINDCAGYMPNQEGADRKILKSARSLKLYNLTQYLWLHILAKAREINNSISQNNVLNSNINILPNRQVPLKENSKQGLEVKDSNVVKFLKESQEQYYLSSGHAYLLRAEYAESEELLKKAIEINPNNSGVYLLLGRCYHGQGKYALAEEAFKKAIELNPENSYAYYILGETYKEQGIYTQAKNAFEKAIAIDPENHSAWASLWQVYSFYREYGKAEDSIKRYMELNKKKGKEGMGYYNLLLIYIDQITNGLIQGKQSEKLKVLISDCTNKVTISNYRKLKIILDQRRIKLVCVQYPTLNIESLRKMFDAPGSIIFVDNKKSFNEAIKNDGFQAYFTDKFGGGFGHCTRRGNGLLAENIAKVIMKEHFNR